MRILLVEDDALIADGLGTSLRKSGYAVDHVDNGLDADTALLGQPYDLLILDLGLPCLLYTSPSPRDGLLSRMPSSA